jgi:Na+/proline symporter
MARYLPQVDNQTNLNSTNLRDPSDVLTAQMAQLNLIANNDNQQQGQDMNLLMNTLLMMPFWSNMCAPTIQMPVLYPNGMTAKQNESSDRILNALATFVLVEC